MACNNRTLPLSWTTLYATSSSTPVFVPCTPWISASSIKDVRAVTEIRHKVGDILITPALQYANVENTVVGTTTTDTQRSADGFYYGTFDDKSATLEGAQLVRFGFDVINSATSTRNLARVAGRVELRDFS